MMLALAGVAVSIWLYLLFGRGLFWRLRETVLAGVPVPRRVAVLIPARDEDQVVGRSIQSIVAQDFPGPFHIFLIDDHSGDRTVEVARAAAELDLLTVIAAQQLPEGWTGKLWALAQGIRRRVGSTFGVGITGIAGPGGGTEEKPVGTVHIALAHGGGVKERGVRFPGDRESIRWQASQAALDMVRIHFLYNGMPPPKRA